MQCPTCNSDNVQKLKLIYESGTHNTVGRSHTTGSVYGSGGGYGTMSASTTTRSKTQSIAAKNVAPPSKKSYTTTILLILAGLIIIKFLEGGSVIGLILLGVGAWLGYTAYTHNKDKWPGAYNTWSKSWQCNKCGHVYTN